MGNVFNTSLNSGSIEYVQNPEAELRDFEARVARPEGLALVRDAVQLLRFSEGKWRRKPRSKSCNLPKASVRALLKKLFEKSFFRIFKNFFAV